MIYEWDSEKATGNLRKHRVSFEEAPSIFLNPSAMTFPDPDRSEAEDREITLGWSVKQRLLFVAYVA